MNRTTKENIRENVEAAWRFNRSRPKSNDSFFGLFSYQLTRTTFFKTMVASLVSGMCIYRGKYEEKAELHKNHAQVSLASGILDMLSHFWFPMLSRYIGRRTVFFICFGINAAVCVVAAITESFFSPFYMTKILVVTSPCILDCLCLYLVELFPTSCISYIFLINTAIYFAIGPFLTKLILMIDRAVWLQYSIFSLLCIFCAIIFYSTAETKGSYLKTSIRETEFYIRSKFYKM